MRKHKSNFLKPYIRKIKRSDIGAKNVDLRTAIRLAMADEMGFKYVMVQRGASGPVMVGRSKQELKRSLLVIRSNKGFNVWANRIKNRSQKN